MHYCVFEYSKASGLFIYDTYNPEITGCNIRYNFTGISSATAVLNLNQMKIHNNSGDGVHYYTSWATSNTISDFEINNNGGRGLSTSTYSYVNASNGIIRENIEGGISIGYESWPHFDNILIEGNGNTDIDGGGIVADGGCILENLTIQNNKAYNGGGIASLIFGFEDMHLSNSTIKDNVAINNGGGIYHNGETLNMSNIQISNNLANNGGGIAVEPSITEMSLDSSIVKENMAFQDGGGIYINGLYSSICTIENVEITSNQAGFNGGGIYNSSLYNFEIDCKNLTTVSNFAGHSGGGLYCAIADDTINYKNSIFWNNTPGEIIDTSGYLKITYSNIEGGYTGYGNINSDPLFVDPENGDYHLSWLNYPLDDYTKSPCIGTASGGTSMGTYAFDNSYYEPYMPVINSIVDVPNDQGKQVVINWTRSILDANGGPIDKYTIWRKQNWAKEPWEYMGATPAQHFEEYAFIAPTVKDSSSIGIPYFTYLITAVDVDSNLFYNSYPDSGYSVDNIAPYPPEGLTGVFQNDSVYLKWNHNLAEDFDYFAIYKSNDKSNFPDSSYYALSDTNFIDLNLVFDTIYYFITAFDYNCNESQRSDTIAIPIATRMTLDLTVILEGPYFNGQMTPFLNVLNQLPKKNPYDVEPWNYDGADSVNSIPFSFVIDWVLVELFTYDTTPNPKLNVIGRQTGFLLNNGSITGLDGVSMLQIRVLDSCDFYARIYHRNHIPIVTSTILAKDMGAYSWDFTTGAENVLGGIYATKEISTNLWGMIAGDGNTDGSIDNSDKNDVWLIQKDSSGYLAGDFNMDSQVDLDDKIIMWQTNVGKGIIVLDTILESKK